MAGGGSPSERAVRALVARCQGTDFYPGRPRENAGGRPPSATEHQRAEVARVAMDLKRRRLAPSPARVRAVLPRLTLNKETGEPLSDRILRDVFKTRCYDETEDDPWQWLPSASQDYLQEKVKPLRVRTGRHILSNFHPNSWTSHVAIDPCSSLLPRVPWRLEEQQVAAMGKNKWTSKGSRKAGVNLRAAATALKQAGPNVLQVHWTPVFARGKIFIHVCDPAAPDPLLPAKLNDGNNLAMFVRKALPDALQQMQQEHGWASIPRVVVHDKASYMVNSVGELLNPVFGGALTEAGFRSWTGPPGSSTSWLCSKLGDVYLHETAISHIRRLLSNKFVCTRVDETFEQFKKRMRAVQDFMNSDDFSAEGGGGLQKLAKELPDRCRELLKRKGERLPK